MRLALRRSNLVGQLTQAYFYLRLQQYAFGFGSFARLRYFVVRLGCLGRHFSQVFFYLCPHVGHVLFRACFHVRDPLALVPDFNPVQLILGGVQLECLIAGDIPDATKKRATTTAAITTKKGIVLFHVVSEALICSTFEVKNSKLDISLTLVPAFERGSKGPYVSKSLP